MSQTSNKRIYKCHKCSTLISIDPSQIESINKQQKEEVNKANIIENNDKLAVISKQCVYIHCSIRSNNKFECTKCSDLELCRNCNMSLCKSCRGSLKVLQCVYCESFICSQLCYGSLLKKYFVSMQRKHSISINAHQSMHFLRKLLIAPYLHSFISDISNENLPFHVCDNCKAQNCGCIDWLCCVNCRKYYCIDCEHNVLQKCKLSDCHSYTCCHKNDWNRNCDYCNRFGECQLLFCTKGHCNRHIIINREIGFGELNDNKSNNDHDHDDDIDL